jgi:Mrp family chromosome partitioning ATPase
MGLIVAFFWEAYDATLHTREHVERRLSLPLLAVIPALTPRRRWWRRTALPPDTSLVLNSPAGTTATESYRFFHTRLKHYNNDHGIRTILFVSAELKDAAPAVIAHLGIVAASMGWKTLLLDANLQQPGLHRLLQCPVAPGLAESLSDPSGWQKSIQRTHIGNLHLLPAGVGFPGMPMSAEISAVESILGYCKEIYELILCTAPPVLGYAETLMLSTKIEATCLVLTCDVSRSDAVEEAKSALEAVGANVVGTLLTNGRG